MNESHFYIYSFVVIAIGIKVYLMLKDYYLLKDDQRRTKLVQQLLKPDNIQFNTFFRMSLGEHTVDPTTGVFTFVFKDFIGQIYENVPKTIYFYPKQESVRIENDYKKVNHEYFKDFNPLNHPQHIVNLTDGEYKKLFNIIKLKKDVLYTKIDKIKKEELELSLSKQKLYSY